MKNFQTKSFLTNRCISSRVTLTVVSLHLASPLCVATTGATGGAWNQWGECSYIHAAYSATSCRLLRNLQNIKAQSLSNKYTDNILVQKLEFVATSSRSLAKPDPRTHREGLVSSLCTMRICSLGVH